MSMSNEKTYVGNSIKLQAGVAEALATGKPKYSKIYSDSEGVWVSAFAPILNSEGKAIAAFEVDYHAEREIAAARPSAADVQQLFGRRRVVDVAVGVSRDESFLVG